MHRRIARMTTLVAALWLSVPGGHYGAAEAGAGTLNSTGFRPAATPPNLRESVKSLEKGVFLIASRQLNDPNFIQSVVLLLEYDATGALGLIINRPSEVPLASALPEVEGLVDRSDILYVGGPVGRNQLFLLLRAATGPEDADLVVDQLYASVSLDTLRRLLADEDAEFHAHAGYAGWGPGQLDAEVTRGDWHVSPADAVTVFDQPSEDVWPALIRKNAGLWVRRTGIGNPVRTAACIRAHARCPPRPARTIAEPRFLQPHTQSSSR